MNESGREGGDREKESLIYYLNAVTQKNYLHELCHCVKLDENAHNNAAMNHLINIVHSMSHNLCLR